ncbi:MAG: PAS domain S-box protein [Lacibacter sp.]
MTGKDDFDLVPYETALRYRKTDLEVLLSEQPIYGLKESFVDIHGDLRFILINKTPLRNQHGAVIGILGTYIDITALTEAEEKLKATSRLYLLISQLNQMFIRQKDESKLLQETCNMAVQYGGFLMSWIGKVDENTGLVVPLHIAGKEDGYFQAISGISAKDIPIGRGPTGTSIRERRMVYSEDIANDPMMLPWREEALKRGYRSSLSVPIIVNDAVKFTFTLYSAKPYHFNDEQETQLIQEIADDLSFTITALENERQNAAAEKRAADYIYALNESVIVDISDSAGRITFANENFYRITGYTPEEVMGQDHKILNSKYHDKKFYETLWGTILKGKVWRGEVRNKAKDGRLFWVDTTIVPFLDDKGKPVQFISIRNDITDRKNAEAEKLMLLERYELITQATSDTMWDLDVTTNTIVYNQNYTKIYGYKQRVHQNSMQWFQEHVHPDDWPRVKALLDRTFRFKRHKMQDQYRYRCADGTYKYVLDRAYVLYDAAGNPVRIIGSMQDITKERELNQQIEKAVIAAQEKEWNQLGMELHDNVNQILAASMIYLNFAEEKIKEGKDAVQEIKKSEDLLRNAVQEIRRLSHQLAPASVDKMNIRQVIDTLVETLEANNRFTIHLDLQQAGELPMTANLQTQLFRILQEQFNNIIKHAHARNVTISLRKTADALVLRVADDGKGKDISKSEQTTGIGLENIRRRVTALGGSLHIYTAPGKGFTLEVVVPLEKI